MSETRRGERATRPEEKAARRSAILAEAGRMLDERGWDGISMAELARRCALAKGTLYLYFRTKEAVFLALLAEAVDACFARLAVALERAAAPLAPETIARLLADAVCADARLPRLLGLLHLVLERNVDVADAHAFKARLRDHVVDAGERLERVAPWLDRDGGARLLMRLDALVVGLQQMADPAPAVREAIADDARLALFEIDFDGELRRTLAELCKGVKQGASTC